MTQPTCARCGWLVDGPITGPCERCNSINFLIHGARYAALYCGAWATKMKPPPLKVGTLDDVAREAAVFGTVYAIPPERSGEKE